MSFALVTLSIQENTRRAVFLADHARLEFRFPFLDRPQHTLKCILISSISRGNRSLLIQKSSGGQEGRGLTFSSAGGRIISTMSDLAAKTCVPCRGGVSPLKGEDLSILQKQVDGWNIIEEHHITKTFKFPDFRGALKFVNHVGELAEEQGHHPDISLAWGKVDITTWTHKINGLTESDFILAAKIDQLPKS
jgi:4a-hydroxytetrahydrobiopterin dehydratase